MRYITIILFLVLLPILSLTQTISDLEARRKETERRIEVTNEMLQQTEKQREQSLNELNLLANKIDLQQNLVTDIETQIILTQKDIEKASLLIEGLRIDLNNMKREYAKLIRFAWKNQSSMHIIMFIFASYDFNQAYRRFRFYQQYIQFREKQAQEIIATTHELESEINQLDRRHRELADHKSSYRNEIQNLNREQTRYSRTVTNLRQKERELQKELQEHVSSMEAISKAIEELIAEEARKAAEAREPIVRDARYISLSEGFQGNRGRLPWPARDGVIVGQFGEHNHPVLRGVKIKNNGIDISTQQNEEVKSIFDGEVKRIVNIPGANVAVIIRHGDFFSVYSNLSRVQVRVGDTVKADQTIGKVFTDSNSGRSVVNLQIWKENQMLNPEHWILP